MDDIKLRARAKINITLDAIRKWKMDTTSWK